MAWRSIHKVTNDRISLFLLDELYFIIYMEYYDILYIHHIFIRSSIDRYFVFMS